MKVSDDVVRRPPARATNAKCWSLLAPPATAFDRILQRSKGLASSAASIRTPATSLHRLATRKQDAKRVICLMSKSQICSGTTALPSCQALERVKCLSGPPDPSPCQNSDPGAHLDHACDEPCSESGEGFGEDKPTALHVDVDTKDHTLLTYKYNSKTKEGVRDGVFSASDLSILPRYNTISPET